MSRGLSVLIGAACCCVIGVTALFALLLVGSAIPEIDREEDLRGDCIRSGGIWTGACIRRSAPAATATPARSAPAATPRPLYDYHCSVTARKTTGTPDITYGIAVRTTSAAMARTEARI